MGVSSSIAPLRENANIYDPCLTQIPLSILSNKAIVENSIASISNFFFAYNGYTNVTFKVRELIHCHCRKILKQKPRAYMSLRSSVVSSLSSLDESVS